MRHYQIIPVILMLAGCGTSANMTSKMPEPYGGIRTNWDYIADKFEKGTVRDHPLNVAAAAVDMPFSLLCDTFMLPKFAYDYWIQESVDCPCDAYQDSPLNWRNNGQAFKPIPAERVEGIEK